MIALKFNEDIVFDNQTIASLSNLPLKAINDAEALQLMALDYRLVVPTELFAYYEKHVQEYAQICLSKTV